MADKSKYYYQARGFSIYYFANAAFNIVRDSHSYIRGIEYMLGDMRTLALMRPFQKFTNLHNFLSDLIREIVEEDVGQLDEGEPRLLVQFLSTYDVPFASIDVVDEDKFYDFTSGCAFALPEHA
ncbi:hypothetical protein VHN57_17410 [Sphingobium sp. WW5]|jgi:hypothetical protein|uniref:hypothetical protein n=1 Tax=unclassified Sphingobium TaxID=2611147 RepID=UPI003C0D2B39